jgi:phage-related protein
VYLVRYSVPPEVHVGDDQKRLPARFYKNQNGREPVREWLLGLKQQRDRKIIGADIKTVEFGWPIGMPTCRPLGGGLWEVRSDLPRNRIGRVLFCEVRGEMVLLHGMIKKTRTIPKKDLDIARARQKEVEQ